MGLLIAEKCVMTKSKMVVHDTVVPIVSLQAKSDQDQKKISSYQVLSTHEMRITEIVILKTMALATVSVLADLVIVRNPFRKSQTLSQKALFSKK
jgi:hypothetical protein